MKDAVVIVHAGLTTAVGLNYDQTCASVRAGIAGFNELDWLDKTAQPFVASFLPDECLPAMSASRQDDASGDRAHRLGRLALMTLDQMEGVAAAVPLLMGWPEDGGRLADHVQWLEKLDRHSHVPIDIHNSRIYDSGRAAGMTAVHHARRILLAGQSDFVMAGAVDTYKDLMLMGQLDRAARIKSMANLDGFIPGEGAGFLLMTTRKVAAEHQLPVICTVGSSAVGVEAGHLFSDVPYRGDGLAATINELFAAAPAELSHPRCVFSSMNGEYYWAKEWGVATVRCHENLDPEPRFEHPADCYGDIGAAAGPAMIALAARGMQKGYLPGPVLIYCASDGGERAAAIVDITA